MARGRKALEDRTGKTEMVAQSGVAELKELENEP